MKKNYFSSEQNITESDPIQDSRVDLGFSSFWDATVCSLWATKKFFLNVFTEFAEFSDKIFVITVKWFERLPPSHLLC